MKMLKARLSSLINHQKAKFNLFTRGGDWSISLSKGVKNNLSWFFFDGLFASASDNIIVTYFVLYLLALGATQTQIGLLSSFSSLASALMLIPGALLVERIGHRKELTFLFGGGLGRLVILVAAILPFFFGGTILVWTAIAFSVMRDAAANLSFPAWVDMTGAIVPINGRGRYFGSRNFIMATAGMIAVIAMGELINRTGQPGGYQVALTTAVFLGAFSTYAFSRINDPFASLKLKKDKTPPKPIVVSLRQILNQPAFISFVLITALWNLSVNIAGPFFNVFLVENLNFTAGLVGFSSIASSLASMLIQRKSGELADRWGPRRIQMLCMVFIPLLTLSWAVSTKLWHILLINIFSGFLWGTYNLASFNFFLSLLPVSQRARYSAVFQVFTTIALAFGAAIGSLIVSIMGIQMVFLVSAACRFISALIFLRFAILNKTIDQEPY
jgi:MFS family permease